jgi:hypothetical protein
MVPREVGVVVPGTVLKHRYRLDGPIALGGVGEVWRGTDLVLRRVVAVNLLRPEYAQDEPVVPLAHPHAAAPPAHALAPPADPLALPVRLGDPE